MEPLYKTYCTDGFDENGILNRLSVRYPDQFNFGYDIVDEWARREPDRRALYWVNTTGEERQFSFSELSRLSNQAANVFLKHGIRKGDVVMLILKRHYQYWYVITALHKIGAIAVPATHLLTTKDLVYRIDAASIKAVVCTADGEVADDVDAAQPQCDSLQLKFMVNRKREGWLDMDEEIEQASDALERVDTNATDPFLLYFTSGATGYPKMALHDHTYPLGHILTAVYWQNVDPEGIHLTLSDTGWAKAAWGKIYGQWIAGTTVFVYDFDKFVPEELLHMLKTHRITTFCAPPTVFRFLIQEDLKKYPLPDLTYATIAGEALNPEVYHKFYQNVGVRLMEGFGQSETTVLLGNVKGMTPKPGSMGIPLPLYDIDLYDENDQPVPAGTVGEIVVKVPKGKKQIGLYRAEEKTEEVWHNGHYHTGDTAWKDEDGYYWYVGRTDDLIKSSGYRIGPFEIESVLMEHPSVVECAVTGADDPIRGRVVKATIVLAKGYTPSSALKKEIQTFVKNMTAPYKYPRIVEFVEELPKTVSGKIKRADIRKQDEQA